MSKVWPAPDVASSHSGQPFDSACHFASSRAFSAATATIPFAARNTPRMLGIAHPSSRASRKHKLSGDKNENKMLGLDLDISTPLEKPISHSKVIKKKDRIGILNYGHKARNNKEGRIFRVRFWMFSKRTKRSTNSVSTRGRI